MGLDMYAYVATKADKMKEYYENYDWEKDSSTITKPRELAYWRKHPNLHGWMENLYREKGGTKTFNGIELELSWEDINRLEKDIKKRHLPDTTGFFFGNPADNVYYHDDLKFCIEAKAELFLGLKVFYNSSW